MTQGVAKSLTRSGRRHWGGAGLRKGRLCGPSSATTNLSSRSVRNIFQNFKFTLHSHSMKVASSFDSEPSEILSVVAFQHFVAVINIRLEHLPCTRNHGGMVNEQFFLRDKAMFHQASDLLEVDCDALDGISVGRRNRSCVTGQMMEHVPPVSSGALR